MHSFGLSMAVEGAAPDVRLTALQLRRRRDVVGDVEDATLRGYAMRTTATVRIRVVVGVEVSSTWGPNCTVAQVRDQGAREGEAAVRQALSEATALKVLGVEALEMTVVNEAER